jgi:hypothetical protein
MTQEADGQYSIAANRQGKRQSPHPAQHLENHVPDVEIGDVPERAFFVVEYEVPHGDDTIFHYFSNFIISQDDITKSSQ